MLALINKQKNFITLTEQSNIFPPTQMTCSARQIDWHLIFGLKIKCTASVHNICGQNFYLFFLYDYFILFMPHENWKLKFATWNMKAKRTMLMLMCIFWPQVYTRYGKCYTFNGNKTSPKRTRQGGMGNGLELMLDIQQDEYLPIWRETSESVQKWKMFMGFLWLYKIQDKDKQFHYKHQRLYPDAFVLNQSVTINEVLHP